MSALALETASINLGQGFPDTDGPAEISEAAQKAIADGHNQYPPGAGILALREEVSKHQSRYWGLEYHPADGVLITAGATEAIAASLLALCEIGDEVVLFEPFYDAYAALVAMAGAQRRVVTLTGEELTFSEEDLRAQITARTRALVLNSPHNPTGKVFNRDELEIISRVCIEFNLIAITDEVYEHLVFEGTHIPLASLPGMFERTITVSSAAKTYSFTGWKIGWACSTPQLIAAIRTAKQYLTYVSGAPFQHAIAYGLSQGDRLITPTVQSLAAGRQTLSKGLEELSLAVLPSGATYFLTTDIASLGENDGLSFARSLPRRCGVVVIPSSVFYDNKTVGSTQIRWTFCKSTKVLEEAIERLRVGLGF